MKVLFVSPPTDHMLRSEVPEVLSTERGHNPPLGILYLASSLKAAGYEVGVLDAQAEELDQEGIRRRVRQDKPDLTAITATSFTLIDALQTAESVKEAYPDVPVVLGGPHATIYPRETVELDNVDYAVSGEGEEVLVKLASAVDSGESPDIPGVAYRSGGETLYGGRAPFIMDLDALPFPDRTLLPYRKYTSLLAKRNPVTTLFSSRGCPYRCMFCDRPQMGKVFRARSAENVVDEIEECVGLGINELLIYDDTFTVDRQRVLDICSEIKMRGLDVGFDVRARVNTVDPGLLAAMRSAGCERIHYGVESGNQEILDFIRKGITLKQVVDAFKWTREEGIDTLAYFMLGHPRDTRDTIEQTIDFAVKLDPMYTHFTITTPFPATDLYRLGLEEGVIESDVWLEYARRPTEDFIPPVWEENLSMEELQRLLKNAYKRFYVRPSYVLTRLLKVRSPSELKRKVMAGLKVIGW